MTVDHAFILPPPFGAAFLLSNRRGHVAATFAPVPLGGKTLDRWGEAATWANSGGDVPQR